MAKKQAAKKEIPELKPRKSGEREPIFVVQKHDASRLHYDFRLEAGGVLKSWAVPKGPSSDSADKRLAVAVEDHPLDYAGFEGTIPEGEYGGGTVMVWDMGTYRNLNVHGDEEISVEKALAEGHCKVWLNGKKMKGAYAITRAGFGGKDNWLLVKMKDAHAAGPNSLELDSPSVLTRRTMKQIAEGAK